MLICIINNLVSYFTGLSTPRLLFWIVALLISTVVGNLLRNRYVHPLYVFPGPVWGSATDLYKTYLFSTRRYQEKVQCLHEKYGPVIRLAPNLLSFTDPLLLPEVYHRTAEKTPFYSTGLAGGVAPLLQIQSHSQHAEKKKVLAPTYSMKRMKLLENNIDQRIVMVNRTLRSKHALTGAKVDLSEWARWYVYDVVTHLIYGEPVGFVAQEKDVDGLIEAWHDMFRLGGLVATLPWLIHPLITSWPLKRYAMPQKGQTSGSGAIMSSHEKLFQRRLQKPELAEPGNIFDGLRQTKHPDGSPFSPEQAEHECYLLTIASQDTTAALISPLVGYIAQDAAIVSKLLEEIRTFEKEDKLSSPVAKYDETTKMPYFMACVRETLRIHPPTPINLPRYVPRGGMVLDGKWVPETVEIGANPHLIHRNEDIYGQDVGQFRPERWLENAEQIHLMDKYDFTWGYGSRRCVGKNIALMDSQKFVLQLFRDFQIRPVTPDRPWKTQNWGINLFSEQWVYLQERDKL